MAEFRIAPDPAAGTPIDGNSFYCSCERVFDSKLAAVPAIVLTNTDGCAFARTAEAEALGIETGDPYFEICALCRRRGARVELARDLRATARGRTGIPTCLGIGATKTRTGLAGHIAKSVPARWRTRRSSMTRASTTGASRCARSRPHCACMSTAPTRRS